MKKLMILGAVLATALVSQANMQWSWWLEGKDAKADISLGLVNRIAQVDTLEISAIYSGSPVKDGLQWSVFGINEADSDCGLQFSFWFNRGKDPCAQVACVNVNKKSSFDLGFVNFSDATSVQIGLLNFNKNGFLPIFPFINIDKSVFQ